MVNAISTYPSFFGLAKETAYGTPVAATAFVPSTSIASEDVKNYVGDTAMRGSAVDSYNQIPTQGWGTFNADFPVYMDTIGWFLKGLLGAEDVSGSGPYVHIFAVNNASTFQPPSFTFVDYNGVEARSYPGCVVSQLEFTLGADSLLTASMQAQGLGSSSVSKPSQSFSAKTAQAGYTGAITLGGSATTLIESATITLTRGVNPIIAVNNSTSPTQIWAGPVSATLSLTCLYISDTAFLTPFLSGANTAIDVTYTNGADSLELHFTDGLFTKAPITRNGNGWMEVTVDVTATANTTDANTAGGGYSPVKATLTNTTATY